VPFALGQLRKNRTDFTVLKKHFNRGFPEKGWWKGREKKGWSPPTENYCLWVGSYGSVGALEKKRVAVEKTSPESKSSTPFFKNLEEKMKLMPKKKRISERPRHSCRR